MGLSEERQAGDIEITEEMTEAGADLLRGMVTDLADGVVTSREVSVRVYETMELARLSNSEQRVPPFSCGRHLCLDHPQ